VLLDHAFSCPYCGESITMVLDLTVPQQTYIADCEVSCRPIEIHYATVATELAEFQANRGDD
jgi:hypothetical protein